MKADIIAFIYSLWQMLSHIFIYYIIYYMLQWSFAEKEWSHL